MGGGRDGAFDQRRPLWEDVKVQNELLFRILFGILLGVVLGISGTFRHRADKAGGKVSLREDGPAISKFIIVARILMLAVILSQLFRPQWIQWATLALPTSLRWLGAGIGVAAIPLIYWVMSSLGKNVTPTSATRKDASLVTSGPYRWVRHPLYSVGILFLMGMSLLTANWLFAVFFVLAFLMMRARMPMEERRLIEKFGDEYRSYMGRTGRIFPRLLA